MIRIILHRAFTKWRMGSGTALETRPRSRESFSEFASWNSANLNMCLFVGMQSVVFKLAAYGDSRGDSGL
jgi:hypothetical protein